MITTILVEHPWLSPLAMLLLVVLGPVVVRWLLPRPRLAWALTGASLVPLALLTLVPVERELYARCEVAWTLPTPGRVELAANVVLFVVPALLAVAASRRSLVVLLGGTLLSAGIEAFQALVPALGRSCSTNDWLSNSVGALVGVLLAASALALARRRDRDDRDAEPGERHPEGSVR